MRSGSVQALSKDRGSMGLWEATVFLLVIVVTTAAGQTCNQDIPFDYNGAYVTYSSATSINGSEWCPDTSKDNAPYIEFRFEPEGQTAVSKIITTTKIKYNAVGYAATYNILLSYPPNVNLNGTLLARQNVSAVRVGEDGNITTYYLVFNASVPFKTVRIEPLSSVDATGGKCMSIYFQGCNTSELCTTDCQNGGTCVGQNICNCREGFFGTDCSLTTDDVRRSPIGSRLRLVNVSSTNFVFNKAKFTRSVSTGVSVNLSRIDLNGSNAYLWAHKADLDKPFDSLMNIESYSAFTIILRFRMNRFNRDRPPVILATDAFNKIQGVNIFVQNDNGVNSLNVTFRRSNRQWTAIASTEALQKINQWVSVNIRWENTFGLVFNLNGKETGRALVSTSSNNEEAAYLCLGYPSYGYESYDNSISIRDLTIIPTLSSQIRPSIEAGASSLRIDEVNGTVSSQQLGSSLRVSSSSGFSTTGSEIRLNGNNVYLTTSNPAEPFDLLLHPSRYQTFTGSFIFSVDKVSVVNYIIGTGNVTGVSVTLGAHPDLELVVELKWVFMQHRVTYRFSEIDIPRLTGLGVKVSWSCEDSVVNLYIDDSLKAVSTTPVTTYTLNPATTLCLGFPSSTYNESALLVGLTIRDFKIWLYSWYFAHLPDIADDEVQADDGSDVGNNVDDQSLKGQACDREIPFSYTGAFVTYSSSSSVSSYNGSEWCPDTSKDNAPYIEFRFEPEGQTAVSKIITTTKVRYNTVGYAATYNILLSYPPNVNLNGTLLARQNVSAVRVGEDGNITTYYLVFNASVPLKTVRIEPVSSVDATGGKCMSIYFQGCNTSELCTTACQNGGTCVGQNICNCREGFFGTDCSLTTDDVRRSPTGSRLRLVNVSSTNFVFNKAKFTRSVSTGVSVNLSRIDLNGSNAYLWAHKADLDKPFDSLVNIESYSAFTIIFRFRMNRFNRDRPPVLLATDAFNKTQGVNIFVQNDNGVNSLNVTFRRSNRQWTATASTEALQKINQWVSVNIRWENTFGLEFNLNGKETGRALASTSSNNEEAAYLCLGYPSYGYESYDNSISIRDLTIIPTLSSQIRPSIEAGASSLRIDEVNGTVSSQQLGSSLRVSSSSGFSTTGSEIRLNGNNVYLTTSNPALPFDLLLHPSRYQTFTGSFIFSVDKVSVVNYIIGTGNVTGVSVTLGAHPDLELVVELKWVFMQHRVTYRFSEIDIPRLTGAGVKVAWSCEDSMVSLYIDDSLKAVSTTPVTTYTLNPATTLCLGFPSSTYNESALLVGLTVRDFKIWLYSWYFAHLPDISDDEVQADGGSDVGNNVDDQSLKGQACDREIPFSYTGAFVTYSSSSSVSSYNGSEWCPDTSKDNAPYIEFRFEPEGQTAVSKIITTTKVRYNTVGYAATYNILLSYPPNVNLNGTLLARQNVSAVRVGEDGNITTYYLVFNASVPLKTVRIEPVSSVDATGGKCMSIYFQGCNTSELCTTACQNGGTCVGQNICNCREGFFGTDCSLTTDDVRRSPIGSRLRLVNVSSTNFVFNKAKFTRSVSTGVSVNLSRIDLNGSNAYLWAHKADLDKPFDSLVNIESYSAFTIIFRFRMNRFNRDRPPVLLATDAFNKTQGVNIFVQNDNGVNSLNVTFRRSNRQWTAIASTEALQKINQWVSVNIRWENTFGLEFNLNGKETGRALASTSSNNEEAAYLCLGYPSYGYESYDNSISIRDLTIIPTLSSQIRPSIEAGASSLRIDEVNGTVSSQQLGSSLRVSSSSGFSTTGSEIRLNGNNVYLTTSNPALPFDLLLHPSRYQTFTGSFIFSVDKVSVVNYIIGTGNVTGVSVTLGAHPDLELVVELKWVFMQHRVTYRFSEIDIPRLTGAGVKVAWSCEDSMVSLYIDDSLKAVSTTPVTTYTLNPATTLCLGFPSSTYNESALLVGLTVRDFKIWLYSWYFAHLPDISDDEVQADGGSDVGNNVDDQSLKGQACDREIPFSYTGAFVTYSSSSSVSSYNGSEWCPDTSKDNAPYIEFRFEPEGQTAVSKIITTTKVKYNTVGYAATYNILLSYPPNVNLNGTLLARQNVSAVRVGEDGNITTYYLVFNASVPFKTVRIEPVSSVDATGGKCMSIYFQGCNTSELCTTACQNGGTCVGQNICNCREGFFGTDCSLTTDDVRRSPIGSRLRLVNVNSTKFVFNKAKFTRSVSTGVSVNLSRIDLNGSNAYLWAHKADLDKPFDSLANIDPYSAFSLTFRFRMHSLNRHRPPVLLATNAFNKTQGVNIFVQNDNGVNSLNVSFRRSNRQWTATASTEALQKINQWVTVKIRWENTFGLEFNLNGKETGRALASTSSNNEEAAYLCLGYPSYGYESYDNSISIRDLTIIPTLSSQIRPSIEAGASSLRIDEVNGTISSQQLGSSLRVSSSSGFSTTGSEIRLNGNNVYLTTSNPALPFDLLLHPSRYQTFTGSFIFSVDKVSVVNYIIGTGNVTGVSVTLGAHPDLELVVELKWVFMQHRVTYRFSEIDIPRLTGAGVKVSWSCEDSMVSLYIDDILKAVSTTPVTTYTLNPATTLCLGFPSSTYNKSALLVGLTVRDFKIWLYSWYFAHLPDIPYEEDQAPENGTDEEVVTDDLGSSVDARSCSGVITRRQEQVFHLLFTALQADTPERTPVCSNLSIYLARTQEILISCWRTAEAGNDSISEASFLHYSQRSLADAFSTILTVICDGSLPRESSEKCDLTGIKTVLTSFFSTSLRIGQGEQECSLLWTERERLSALVSSCGATTKAVMGELSAQTVAMVEIACSPATCSIDYAQLCVGAAEEALTSVTGSRASGDVCMDVKFSLACITNHTVDCSGVQYLRLSEQTRSLYARYRDVCGVNDSSEPDHKRLSVQHGQWLIQAAAVNRLLPNPLLCSLRSRQEWTGQNAQLSLSPLAHPYFENICNEISATSRCNLTACAGTPCGSLSRNCLIQNSSSCAGLNGFESLLSLQKDQDRRCGNASSSSLLVSTGRPALDAVLLSFRRVDYQGIKDLCQWLPRLRNSLATIHGDDVILEQAISFSTALAQSIGNTVCSITAPPDNETSCPAALNSIGMAIEAFDLVVKSPFLEQSRREELCRLSLVSRSSSGCGTSADDYVWSVLSAAEDIIDQVCQRVPPIPTCDVNKARDSLQELVSAFLLPTDSACDAIDRVEVAVTRATIDCPQLLAWPITRVMGKLRELAESTCYKGQCDPAGAVICLIDVHHMAKLPVPDWEGVCSILNQSALCAKQRVSGCDKCQRDTMDTLVAKVNRQLEDTCRAPPQSPCKAVQAYKCKDVLATFKVSGTASGSNDGLLCMRIFEARKCVQKLTVECDDTTKLAVSIDLEAVVKVINGVTCQEKAVIPKCREVLTERVKSILSYDPLDPEDPSYDQMAAGNNTEYQQPETGEERFVPTYLGRLCQDARSAFQCVQEGLQEFPIGPSAGFFEILNASWTLALTRCKSVTKPLKCYTCTEGKSNEGCNGDEQELCPPDRQMCYTRVVRTPQYQNITISKGCIAPLDCRPGSDGTSQTFCCDGAECNQPDNGPLPATCSLSRVSACLDALSGAVLESNSINCSLVVQQTACFEFVQEECKSNGVTEVSQTLSAFLNSSTVQECFVRMSDSRCGLYAATALSSLLATASDDIPDSTLCPMLVAVDRELRLATYSGKCDVDEIIAINSSYALLKSQLWDRDCKGVTESTGTCQPLAALDYLIQNIDFALPDCGMEAVWELFNNLTAGCQPVHLQQIKLYVSTLPARCNASSVPSLPVNSLFPDACLEDIFLMALANNFSAENMDRIIQCLIQDWSVDFYMNLPPSYRVYSEQSITFIFSFFDGILNLFDGILISSNVSERCKSSQEEVARLQAVEVLQMIFLPFAPVSESNAFCKVTKSIEDKISLLLTQKCQDDEVKLQSKLLTYLQTHRLSFCPAEEPAPTCLKSSAQECIVRFTTFMVTAKIGTDEVCRAVSRTLQCVRSYTALCSSEDVKEVNREMINIAELYYTCPEVKAFVCENSIIQSFNISSSITSLDRCGTATGTYSCSFVRNAVRCYNDTITAVPAVLQNAVSHFKTKYPFLQEFGKDFCDLDVEFWTIGDQCTKPTCNIDIDSCLTVENSTGETVDISRLRQCLDEHLAGCDVVSRSVAVYKIWHHIEIFIMEYGLNITWSRDSDIISTMRIMEYISKLEISLRNPKWNLLDICWYFDDLKGIQDALADHDSILLKSVLERPIRALERSLASDCKDPGIIGVILDLPAEEDERCPQELQAELIFALVQSVFAGFQPMDAREQLCETLERLNSVSVTACSLGFQKQVELLKTFIRNLGENICSQPFYCSLERAQQCVSEMVAVVQGIGTSSSKKTVCSSLNIFDQCIAHASFQCDDIKATKIELSVESVRELAVSICSEEVPTPSPDTCKAEIEDGCKQVDARKCSRKQLLALMSPLIDNRRHCRALAYTEDCYNRLTKACSEGNSPFRGFSVRFPPAVIQGLQEQRKCKDPQIYIPSLVDCTVNCNISQATICITTLESELRSFDPLGADDACSFIRVARQCLDSQTSNCSDDTSKPLYSRLDSVLEYFSDISSSCKDFSSCLSDLTTLSAKILAAGGNSAANASQVLDIVGEVSLDVLCAQASTVWQCVSTKLSLLSSDQYRLVQPIIDPLRKLHDDQCDATVKLRCYHCNGAVLDGTNNKNDKCSNDRACGQKQTRCFEYFEEKESKDSTTEILMYRGCMEPQECQERKGQNGFYCCSSEHCNDGEYEDKDPVPELNSCYDRDAVTCAFNYIWALIRQNTIPCRSALANLQCVATHTQACDRDKGLYEAATQLMLTLAQSTCISGPLSPQCHPLALLSMNAILTNAFSADSACIAWQQANQSLTVLEAHGTCTSLDLVAIRESLSFASVITYTFCHPGDCIMSNSSVSEAGSSGQDGEGTNAGSGGKPTTVASVDCDYYGASKCGRDALYRLEGINSLNSEQICKDVKANATCAVKILKNCELESPCLKNLVLQVEEVTKEKCGENFFNPPAESDNSNHTSTSQNATCKPKVMCNLERAMECIDGFSTMVNDTTELCRKLQLAVQCRIENVASCRSLQSMLTEPYFKDFHAVLQQCPDVNLNPNPSQDVYSGASMCVQTILQNIYDGIGANDEPEDVFCGATASLSLCDFTVPDLNNNSTLGKFKDHFSLISKDLCTDSDPSKVPGSREKRENGSSNWDLAFALITVLRSNFFSIIPLEQRPGICKRVNTGLKLLDSYIENITQIALTKSSQIFLQRIQSEGWNQFFTYCSDLDWEPSGCRPDYFQTCMKPFWKISALALTENGTLCRRASYALQCIAKFSNGCDTSVTRVVVTAKLQVQGVVGNICPNLTLGLFCPSKYSLINNFTCSYSSAQTCLSSVNTNAIDRRFDNYCSNLDKSLSCAKNGLEGCLKSQVDTAAVTLSSKRNLNTELSYCKSSTAMANYSSVCIAREPCSVIGALEHFENAEVSDCGSLASIRSSFESSLQNCNNTQAMTFASSLFIGFLMRFQQQCPSQFQNLPLLTSELSEAKITLVKNLFDALVTSRSKSAVCKAFYDYLESVSNITGQIGSPAAALEDEHGYLQQVLDDFCPGDKTGDSLAQPDGCQLYTAALFVVEELIWPLSSSGLPTADNQEACRRWKEQHVRIAVNKYMARCDRSINDLFADIIELSSRHVAASEMCETTSTCIVPEAFYFINQFSVAVTTYSIDNNAVTLCLKKSETESHVGAFTATCKNSERAIVSASLAQVMSLVTGVCDEVVLPPQPLCPDIPFTQQSCHVVKALVCLVESNLKLLSLDTFIYSDWCTATQQAMSCIAYNTSGCDSNIEDMKAVSSSLDNLRKQAEDRCPWLTPDLCGVNPPCPAEFAGCDIYLQLDLLNNPLDDACSILETANKCVNDSTRTCTRAQRAVAEDSIKRSLKIFPSLTCNANAKDPTSCFLQARAATWQLLTHPNGTANNCQILVDVAECFSSRNVTLPSASLQAALFLDDAIRKSFSKCQGTDPHCGRLTALIINTVYEYISDMATASTFDHVSYCSKRNAILADVAISRQLYNPNCSMSELDDLEDALRKGPEGSLCDVDTITECAKIIQTVQKCLAKFNDIDNCSAATELAVCMAPLGLCSENEQADLISQYKEKVSQMDVCARLPLVLLRASPNREIYLSEQGGSASISFQVVENYTSYLPSDTNSLRMRLRTEIVNIDPLRCMTNDEAEIPQVVVKGTSNCGILVTAADWINQSFGSFELMPVLDGREDGVRRANVILYAEVQQFDPSASSWNSYTESIKLAQYTVAVDNKDSETAVCTSFGYNFFQTFDGSGFSCFESGTYMLYRNKIHHTFVSITVKKSTIAAVYTCAVKVGNANVSVEFNRCLSGATRSHPRDVSVTMTKSGDYDQISVYRTPDFGYLIVFSIGTIVHVKPTSVDLKTYIVASALDFGKTEGLCGLFDGNAYNDYVLPDGQRYTTQANDMQYGVLSPSGFITAWSVDPNEVPQEASGFVSDLAPTCSCMGSNTDVSQCSYITRVATCDYVQGVDITSALAAASEQSKSAPGGRRRRAVEDTSIAESPVTVPGWPTPSNWTQAMAKERCEKVLLEATNLRYCDKAVLTANGSYSYADIFTVCMEEIRVSDTAANLTSITKHAEYVCFMMFVRNITYFSLSSVRDTVLEFLDTTCIPADCNGNGQCRQGVCECKPGYVGGDCAYQRAKLPVPKNQSLVYGNLCYITDSNRCEDIFVSANQLVESPLLACHIKKVEVDHSGAYQSIGPVSVTKAHLMTSSVVQCSWPRTSAQETVAVAISNDGQNPTSAMLISAYDPRCYTCSSGTNYCQEWAQNACHIQGRCYLNGEGASSDNCLYCNPARSATEWTYKDSPDCEVRRNEAKEKDLLSTIHILIIIACITAFAVIVTVVVGIVCKRRLRRKANKQGDLPPPYLGLPDDSSSLSETSFAPQKAFNTGRPYTRAVTQAMPTIPHQD